jgi:hypothetical protein
MTQLKKMAARAPQFPSQSGGAPPLGDAPQDQQHFRGTAMAPLKPRPCPGIEHATAVGTAIIQDGMAMTPVDDHSVGGAATGAMKPVGMQEIQQLLIAGVLVHEPR